VAPLGEEQRRASGQDKEVASRCCPPGTGPGGRPARAARGRGQAAGARRPACTRRAWLGPGSWPARPPAAGLQATPRGGRRVAAYVRRLHACTGRAAARETERARGRSEREGGELIYLGLVVIIGLGCLVLVIGPPSYISVLSVTRCLKLN
jgi:hypothetical protein